MIRGVDEEGKIGLKGWIEVLNNIVVIRDESRDGGEKGGEDDWEERDENGMFEVDCVENFEEEKGGKEWKKKGKEYFE